MTSAILTAGYGTFGDVNLLPTLGFGAPEPPAYPLQPDAVAFDAALDVPFFTSRDVVEFSRSTDVVEFITET